MTHSDEITPLLTEDYRNAPSGIGPQADEWEDKPHRLVYDLCKEVDRLRVRNRELAQELDDLKDWRRALQESLSEIEGSAEELARTFHETYERLAPQFGYETREASAVPWHLVPTANRNLMIAVAAEILFGGAE